MKPNKLRDLLTAGRPTLGTRVHSPWPNVVEAIGHTGMFDYVEFVAEYASFDLFTLENLCRAAELYGLGAMIKIDQEPRTFLAQRVIGCGFGSVLFTDCRSADDAWDCVRSVRRTPRRLRHARRRGPSRRVHAEARHTAVVQSSATSWWRSWPRSCRSSTPWRRACRSAASTWSSAARRLLHEQRPGRRRRTGIPRSRPWSGASSRPA